MGKNHWTDYNIYGRALKAIFLHMNQKYWNEEDVELQHAYLDRMIKTASQIESLSDKVLGVSKLIKDGEKIAMKAIEV